jgi:hypothetical protein
MSTEQQSKAGNVSDQVHGWFLGRLPDGWFTGPVQVLVDREEITVIGTLPAVSGSQAETVSGTGSAAGDAAGADAGESGEGESGTTADAGLDAMVAGRSRRFREETREARIEIAREAESLFSRKVSWGVMCEDRKVMFTTLSVPVMTRLRQAERRVLDTLVDAGVARSRSDALAWCVRLVGQHEDAWLADLREALRRVEHVRADGPRA